MRDSPAALHLAARLRQTSTRVTLALVLLAMLGGLAWRCVGLDRPFVGRHGVVNSIISLHAVNYQRHGVIPLRGLAVENGGEPWVAPWIYFISWSPMDSLVASLPLLVLPPSEWVFRATFLAFMIWTIPLCYALGRYFGRVAGVTAAMLCAVTPLHVWYSTLVCRDSLLLPICMATIWCAVQAERSLQYSKRLRWVAVAGLALGILSGWNAVTLAPLLCLLWLPRWRETWPCILAVVLLTPGLAALVYMHPILAGVHEARELLRAKVGLNALGGEMGLGRSLKTMWYNYLTDAYPPVMRWMFPVGLLALALGWRGWCASAWRVFLLLLGYAVIWPVLMHGSARQHDFMLLCTVPLVCVTVGVALQQGVLLVTRLTRPRAYSPLAAAGLVLLMALAIHGAAPRWRVMFHEPTNLSYVYHATGVVIARHTAPSDWVLTWGSPGFINFYADRMLREINWQAATTEDVVSRIETELGWMSPYAHAPRLWCCIQPRFAGCPADVYLARHYDVLEDEGFRFYLIDGPPPPP